MLDSMLDRMAARRPLAAPPVHPPALLPPLLLLLLLSGRPAAQHPWPSVWVTPDRLDAVGAELAADGDNTTAMRAYGPLRAGASLLVDLRSAVKVTHVVLVEDPDEYLRVGRLTVVKGGRLLTVASWDDREMGRTRTPAGHTVIALSPPLKLSHAPFVFGVEVAVPQATG